RLTTSMTGFLLEKVTPSHHTGGPVALRCDSVGTIHSSGVTDKLTIPDDDDAARVGRGPGSLRRRSSAAGGGRKFPVPVAFFSLANGIPRCDLWFTMNKCMGSSR